MTASKGLRPALLFLSSGASLTTASIWARKLSKGTTALSVSSGSPLALIASRRLSRSKKPGCPTAFPRAAMPGHVNLICARPTSAIFRGTLKLGPDGLIYITCENSAVVAVIDPKTHKVVDAIDSGSTNGHRLIISPDGQRLYTENEEDGTVSVIDLLRRKLLGKITTPRPLAGIAIGPDGRTVIAVDDAQPALFLIDTEAGRVREEIVLKDVPKPAQIARYAPDNSLLAVTSLNSDTVSLIDPSFRDQTAIKVGSQPMDMAFRDGELFVACQGDGSVHIIDIPNKRAKGRFSAGKGCESLGFF